MVHGNLVGVESLSLGDSKDKGTSDSNDSVDVQTKSGNTIPLQLYRELNRYYVFIF